MADLSPSLSSRRVALDLLDDVLKRRRFFDEAVNGNDAFSALEERDRAFVRLLCLTVLRRLTQCERWLDACLDRPLPARARKVRTLLHLGLVQLAFLKTPSHAALSTSVDLCRVLGFPEYAGLVNALLRRFVREGIALFEEQENSGEAARLNTPDWLWQAWERAYGTERCTDIARANLREAPLDLSVRSDPEHWAARLNARLMLGRTLRLEARQNVTMLTGYDEGAWWVQDLAASLPARLLGHLEGRTVVDLCAAPGGKTAQLVAAGARVTAVDRSSSRLKRLRSNLERLRLTADIIAAKAEEWQPDETFDALLLDAPCSATGTIRRHPELPHLRSAADEAKMANTQAVLLRGAARLLKPGGILIYCVCSLQPREGEEQIASFLKEDPSFQRLPIDAADIGSLSEAVTAEGDLRTLPCFLSDEGGMDGFFAARLQKL